MVTDTVKITRSTITEKSCCRGKSAYQQERDIDIADDFVISDSAVKKQSRTFKSVIKLDKNFHIYVHGDSNLIQQGTDENGKFYKIYYKDEN